MDYERNAVAARRRGAGGDRPDRDRASPGVLAAVGHAQGAGVSAGGVRARVLDRAPRARPPQHGMDPRERDLRYVARPVRGHRRVYPVGVRLRVLRLSRLGAPGPDRRQYLPLRRCAAAEGADHLFLATEAAARARARLSISLRHDEERRPCWKCAAVPSVAISITAG